MKRKHRSKQAYPEKTAGVLQIAVLLLCMSSAPYLAAEPIQTGNYASDSSSVDELLALRGEPDFFETLMNVYRSMSDPLEALDLMATFLPVLEGDVERHTLLLDMARLEEQAGRLQKAQLHYQSAAFTGQLTRDYRALFHSMLILIELGDYEYAMVQAQQIIANSEESVLSLQAAAQKARIQQLQGRQMEALQTAQQLYNRRKNLPADVLYSLWVLYQSVPGTSDYSSSADTVEQELSERFPDSPEYGLITRENSPATTVENALGLRSIAEDDSGAEGMRNRPDGADIPDSLHTPGTDPSKTEQERNRELHQDHDKQRGQDQQPEKELQENTDNANPPELEKSTAIQTGSFRDAENARYMQRTLEEEGFTALVTQARVGEAIYYRVLVPIPFGESEERIILQLKEKGFEGYPVY